jgi:hypothetical protein
MSLSGKVVVGHGRCPPASDETLDGLAWIDAADKPEQVISLTIDGRSPIRAMGRTLSKFTPRAE